MNKKLKSEVVKEEVKRFLTFNEMEKELSTRPKTKFLWGGIKEKSFGLVFGPSKSGKTIFCENMAINLAIGSHDYFGTSLDGIPRKVLFIGLEEFWEERGNRNVNQASILDKKDRNLLGENYLYQSIEFTKTIVSKKDWNNLFETIRDSKAEVIFIDSITRMNHGNLEDSKTAEQIMQRLRTLCYDLSITLICIHHTPKMEDKPITMDCIKGSSVFAQESDFAIGINRTLKGNRYMKEVFSRYAAEGELVKEFHINDLTWLEHIGDVDEDEILKRSDRRRDNNKRNLIVDYFNQNTCSSFKTAELVPYFSESLSIKERQVKSYLAELINKKKIKSPKNGIYMSVNCKDESENEIYNL